MGVNRPTGNMTPVAIGCGSSSSVCRLEEAARLLESGRVEYLAFDRLAERTSAQMHLARTRGVRAYSPQWEDYLTALLPEAHRRGVRLVSNAGGEDTAAGLDASVRVARDLGLARLRVAATIPQQDPMEAIRAVDPTVSERGRPASELDGEIIGHTSPHDEAVFGGTRDQVMRSVTSGGPGLVAVGSAGKGGDHDAIVWTSPDGLNWSRFPHDDNALGGLRDQRLLDVVVAGSALVAVGFEGPGFQGQGGDADAAVWVLAEDG